ncbi:MULTISPECIES: DUF885 domain-containing protein [unclassified Novosphingobium]|uniref:DUF885 domain-containing protein n=1 Tax=unclassified Novosphingobium TaxID=2644732 RepID=UPI00146EADB2|nr:MULTISPECIES: DUF885 domain-containing protein [unclassified Novosphingobium]NMN03642.1 uncharacterized protein (DUF885 family) [Novosphingobium sp. SG919]NMN86368.1 uncharacterized protein (DUF885 family) [Novosphingobium sp. SG916]
MPATRPLHALLLLALVGAPVGAKAQITQPAPASAPASTTVSPNAALDALLAQDDAARRALDPLDTLERGEPLAASSFRMVFDPALTTMQRARNAAARDALARIDLATLDAPHRISARAYAAVLDDEQAMLSPEVADMLAMMPLNPVGGLQVEYPGLASAGGPASLETAADHAANLARDRALPQVFAAAIARYREGLARGVTSPRAVVETLIGQIDALLARPPEHSLFMSPAQQPLGLAESGKGGGKTAVLARTRLRAEYRAATVEAVYPAYRTLRAFLADEYLPATRESVGLAALPGGATLYRALLHHHTTLDLDPAQVHALGLAEVARIQAEMDTVKRQLGFAGPLRAFFDAIRVDPRYHPRKAEDLAQGYRRVAQVVAAQAPRFFVTMPRTPLLILPHPAYRARFEAGGSYSPGSADGTRPGVFYYNTFDLKSRFLTGIATLYLHEGAPGHHFQISLAQENPNLPDFQRYGGNTAYVEGWALYAETLGYPMGLFDDPMQHWGTLDDEMLRAMRLVVDTGLHSQGWSRQQALDYMLTNSGMGRSDAQAEVDRYIADPGQAVAYKIGALTIQRLRGEAEARLRARFDLRAFHAQVLGSGALPLPVLESKVRDWIAEQAAR